MQLNAGFLIDFGIFTVGMSIADKKLYMRQGAKEKILEEIDQAYRAGKALTKEEVEKLGGEKVEIEAAERLANSIYDNPEWIKEILPYTKHCHAKFYEMTEDYREPSIDYTEAIRILKENNWDGYISSEYEGQRQYFDMGCEIVMDSVEQLRRHHVLLKKLIGE